MTYNFEDSQGEVGAGPSIGGAHALMTALENVNPRLYPELHELLTTGESSNPDSVKADCEALIGSGKIKDKDVLDTVRKLAMAASQSKDRISVTH
jgi:hypothetical protein